MARYAPRRARRARVLLPYHGRVLIVGRLRCYILYSTLNLFEYFKAFFLTGSVLPRELLKQKDNGRRRIDAAQKKQHLRIV